MKSGYCYIFVGAAGSGKTTLIKRHIEPVAASRLHVYDINDEYGLGDYIDEKGKSYLPEMDAFLDEILQLRESVIVFEDATVFFSTRGRSSKMTKLLVSKRHKKIIVLLAFHSIRDIPYYIYNMANGIYLCKTNDTPDLVDKRIPGLLAAYEKVQRNPPTAYPYVNFEFVAL